MTSCNLCLRCDNFASDFTCCRNLVGTVWANLELQYAAWCYVSIGKHGSVLHAISGSNLMLRPAKPGSL
jgi:hypothetical protein